MISWHIQGKWFMYCRRISTWLEVRPIQGCWVWVTSKEFMKNLTSYNWRKQSSDGEPSKKDLGQGHKINCEKSKRVIICIASVSFPHFQHQRLFRDLKRNAVAPGKYSHQPSLSLKEPLCPAQWPLADLQLPADRTLNIASPPATIVWKTGTSSEPRSDWSMITTATWLIPSPQLD